MEVKYAEDLMARLTSTSVVHTTNQD